MTKIFKLLTAIILIITAFNLKGSADTVYTVKNAVIDNSDNIVLIEGKGTFQANKTAVNNVPVPGSSPNSTNLITNISAFSLSNPSRYVIDIPNAVLEGASRTYKIQNSKKIKSVSISQFSATPKIVRIVFMTEPDVSLSDFKAYTNGTNIIISYSKTIVSNSIQRKFYTQFGDGDKTATLQNTGSILTYGASNETVDLTPRFDTKYYLSKVSKNSDGLILRGLGELAFQKTIYNDDATEAIVVLDNAKLLSSLENKTYVVPSSNPDNKALLTISTLNPKKIKLTLNGKNLKDFRFVMAPDGQSLYISHRSYIINTNFSSETPKITNYKVEKTSSGYDIFEANFSQSVAYDVFELNDNFYLDINNLSDYNQTLLSNALAKSDLDVSAIKISSDKTRFVIPTKSDKYSLNFSYASVESNSKSLKVCFKRNALTGSIAKKDDPKVIAKTTPEKVIDIEKDEKENIKIKYIPKEDEKEAKAVKTKKNKDMTIKSMKKVVIDPGHGGTDGGAVRGTYLEKNLNLIVAKLVQEKLAKNDIYVYMTRSKDTTLTLEDRVNFSNEIAPDVFVSIHTNSTVAGDSFGLETHYFKDDSYDLAKIIHSNFASEKNLNKWETKDRGMIKSRFYVINHTEAPGVLVEMGFISNTEERTKLFTKERQEEIADSITKGILEYLKVK